MNIADVEIMARLHQQNKRHCPLPMVALALEMFRRQRDLSASPAELAKLTGCEDYGYAKRAVREARRLLDGLDAPAANAPEDGGREVPPTGDVKSPRGGIPSPPHGGREVPPTGDVKSPPYKDQEEEGRGMKCVCGSRTHASPPGPGPDPGPSPSRTTLRHADADLDALAERLEALAPGSYWGMKVRQFAPMYPLGWIEEAAQIAAARGKNWEFVAGILRRYHAQGGPDRAPAQLRPTGTDHAPRRMTAAERQRAALDAIDAMVLED